MTQVLKVAIEKILGQFGYRRARESSNHSPLFSPTFVLFPPGPFSGSVESSRGNHELTIIF
jgi:hypothetical protein